MNTPYGESDICKSLIMLKFELNLALIITVLRKISTE